jgi:class 3 adenylate cyclase
MLEGTVTIAFADLEDSTRLVQGIGDRRFAELISRLGEMCRELATPHRGYVPRHEGDGWMLVFGSARRALRWASAIQHGVAEVDRELADGSIRMRIGIHTGEALQRGADFQGMHVNLAARVASVAPAEAVYVSSLTQRIVRGEPEFVFGQPEIFSLKGFDEPEAIYSFEWRRLGKALDGVTVEVNPNADGEATIRRST